MTDQPQLYRICYKSLLIGYSGHGSTAYPRETAQRLADAMNLTDDSITHWIEPVEDEEEAREK